MSQRQCWIVMIGFVASCLLAGLWMHSDSSAGANNNTSQALSPQDVRTQVRSEVDAYLKQNLQRMIGEELTRAMAWQVQQKLSSSRNSIDARVSQTISLTQAIRSQLELYRLQHSDQRPTLAQLQDEWKILLHASDVNGNLLSDRLGSRGFGPYLARVPRNPFNGSTKVAAYGHATASDGWSFDEETGRFCPVVPDIVRSSSFGDRHDVEAVSGMAIVDALPE